MFCTPHPAHFHPRYSLAMKQSLKLIGCLEGRAQKYCTSACKGRLHLRAQMLAPSQCSASVRASAVVSDSDCAFPQYH